MIGVAEKTMSLKKSIDELKKESKIALSLIKGIVVNETDVSIKFQLGDEAAYKALRYLAPSKLIPRLLDIKFEKKDGDTEIKILCGPLLSTKKKVSQKALDKACPETVSIVGMILEGNIAFAVNEGFVDQDSLLTKDMKDNQKMIFFNEYNKEKITYQKFTWLSLLSGILFGGVIAMHRIYTKQYGIAALYIFGLALSGLPTLFLCLYEAWITVKRVDDHNNKKAQEIAMKVKAYD